MAIEQNSGPAAACTARCQRKKSRATMVSSSTRNTYCLASAAARRYPSSRLALCLVRRNGQGSGRLIWKLDSRSAKEWMTSMLSGRNPVSGLNSTCTSPIPSVRVRLSRQCQRNSGRFQHGSSRTSLSPAGWVKFTREASITAWRKFHQLRTRLNTTAQVHGRGRRQSYPQCENHTYGRLLLVETPGLYMLKRAQQPPSPPSKFNHREKR